MRGATARSGPPTRFTDISIHAPHARSDYAGRRIRAPADEFQSTLLMRGATTAWRSHCSPSRNFNPRSSCEERLYRLRFNWNDTSFQSTLLMRGATYAILCTALSKVFQSTLLMRGATSLSYLLMSAVARFQSTLLMRGATHSMASARSARSNFNPRSSCEERHATTAFVMSSLLFQSTLLMRGATRPSRTSRAQPHHFNPRSSCEERRGGRGYGPGSNPFQSTHLMRGAPGAPASARLTTLFQSTLLMRGATSLKISPVPSVRDFNPRSSCEERLTDPADLLARLVISIHAPHARSDPTASGSSSFETIVFQSTLLMRGATGIPQH